MTPAPFLSRHLGDYLLVAQLSEDALGTVFRALYAADERRFVRLRILRSEELSAEAIAWTIRGNALSIGALVHDAIVPRPQLDIVEDIPFMTWDETAGWTLDTMLARVRAFGIRIPAEYALLIAERIAAALEHAHQTPSGGGPSHHGLLWPGFVSISHDATVRVGGFGIAEGILPSLGGLRLTAEIGPYVAPEARHGGSAGANADVYSLGAILVELLTGRRPSLEAPSIELRAGDPRSEELSAFLTRCLAPAEERFASAADAHRALQQMVTGNPFSLYSANLALFLYKLLNPESQSTAASSDLESTNPVVTRPAPAPADAKAPVAAPAGVNPVAPVAAVVLARRRRTDVVHVEKAPPVEETSLPAEPPPPLIAELAPPPLPIPESAVDLLSGPHSTWPGAPASPAWRRPAAGLAAAAAVALCAFLIASQIQTPGKTPAPRRARLVTPHAAPETAAAAPAAAGIPAPVAVVVALPAPPARPGRLEPAVRRPLPAAARVKKIRPELRQPAEDLRFRAALARIEADRINARETAGEIFGEARQNEEDGERFLRQRDYDAAQLAFSRAARLFQKAKDLTWEERLRQSNVTGTP